MAVSAVISFPGRVGLERRRIFRVFLRRPVAGFAGQIAVVTIGFDIVFFLMASGTDLGAGILYIFGRFPFRGEGFLQNRVCQ